jgi:hypothetical protein
MFQWKIDSRSLARAIRGRAERESVVPVSFLTGGFCADSTVVAVLAEVN